MEFTEILAEILEHYDLEQCGDGFDYTVTLTDKMNVVKARATRASTYEALKACLISIKAFKSSDFS